MHHLIRLWWPSMCHKLLLLVTEYGLRVITWFHRANLLTGSVLIILPRNLCRCTFIPLSLKYPHIICCPQLGFSLCSWEITESNSSSFISVCFLISIPASLSRLHNVVLLTCIAFDTWSQVYPQFRKNLTASLFTESLGLPTEPKCLEEHNKIDTGGTVQSLKPYCNKRKDLDKIVRNVTNMEWSVEYTGNGSRSWILSSMVTNAASIWFSNLVEQVLLKLHRSASLINSCKCWMNDWGIT